MSGINSKINIIKSTFGLSNVNTLVHLPNGTTSTIPLQPFTVTPISGNISTNPLIPLSTSKIANADMLYLGGYVFSNLDISGYEIKFPVVLFEVSQKRNIVTTKIQGRDGSIKEYISDEDYEIKIKGTIPGENGAFPIASVTQFMNICTAKQALKINSAYLNGIFGIYNIVISTYTINQEAGKASEFPFTMTAVSDSPIELKLAN